MRFPVFVLAGFSAAFLGSAAAAQTAEQVHISLTSYAFTPSTITLKSGTTYRLHLTNESNKTHDFTAAEFFAASTVAPEDKAKLEENSEIEVEGGQSVDVTLTPSRAGTYPLTCSHFLHASFGMKGTIVVQ
jgi:plastocyanin